VPDHEFTFNPNSPPRSTPQRDLTQRQFLKKLVGTAAGVAGLAALAVLFPAAAAAQTLPHGVPDFCATPTLTSVQAGDWSSPSTWTPARAPIASDVVRVAHAVSVSGTAPVAECVGVTGTLTLSDNSRLTAGIILVYEPGALVAGDLLPITAEIVFADKILNKTGEGTGPLDPEQYGTGLIVFGKLRLRGHPRTPFQRLATDPAAGASSLTLTATPDGWQAGDHLVVPDTRALPYGQRPSPNPNHVYAPQYEERETTAAVTSASVPLDTPLTYAHAGVEDHRAHVANLTRSVTLRSANPNPGGTRAHAIFLHHADVDIRYAAFVDMGRTTEDELDSTTFDGNTVTHVGTNQIGRYPVHFHHLSGPSPAINAYQFVLIGSVIERSKKWPVAVHNSHYGLIEDNVAYDWKGSGFVTEDGSETEVIFNRNFALRGTGFGGREGLGREGVGFWFRGTDLVVTNNVAANILATDGGANSAYGFKYFLSGLDWVTYPVAPGSSTTTMRHPNATPVRQFEGNEVYGAIESGLTFWWVGTESEDPHLSTDESVFKDTTVWNAYNLGIFVYPSYHVTIDGFVQRSTIIDGGGIEFGDYYARDFKMRRLDIRNRLAGVNGSPHTDGTAVVLEDSDLRNHANLQISTSWTASSTAEFLKERRWAVNRVVMVPAPSGDAAAPSGNVVLIYKTDQTANLIKLDEILIENERVYYTQQAADFVVPVTVLNGQGQPTLIGAPVAGKTNQQTWIDHGIAIAGAVAPCTTTRTHFVNAFVCSSGASTNPTVTGGASPNTVAAGGTTLLTANVTPGTNPTSTGLSVTVTTTDIGIPGTTQLFDNGTNGDAAAGDNTFSRSVTVDPGTTAGAKSLLVTVADAQSRGGSGTISVTVQAQQSGGSGARQFVPTSRLEYADNNAFDAGSNFSLSLWVKFATNNNNGEIVRKDGNYILRTAGSNLHWLWWDGTGGLRAFIIPLPSLNQWHQLVITVNANVSEKVYLDGTDLGLSEGSIGGGTRLLTAPFFLGGSSAGEAFNGEVALIGLYSSVLTGANVTALQTQRPNTVATGTLQAYIPLDADTDEKIVGITATPTGTINTTTGPLSTTPTVIGGASPNTVAAGGTTLLTATVTPGTNPTSTGLGVTVATSAIGIPGNTQLFDNATNGDVTAGDNVFSRSVTVDPGTTAGAKSLPVTVSDAQTRTGSGTISLTVGTQQISARQFVPTSRLEYSDNNAFDAGSNFSLSLWVKFATNNNNGEIVRKDGNYILRTAGSNLHWLWWDGTGGLRAFIIPLPSLNQWHQLVITVNANVSEKVYLDGTDLGLSEGLIGGGTRLLTAPFFLGGSSAGEAFNGEASDIGLYSSVLTGANVTALQTQRPNAVATGTLQAYIPLDADTDEKIVGITPTPTGTINTTTRP
jgi:hypothetical protein